MVLRMRCILSLDSEEPDQRFRGDGPERTVRFAETDLTGLDFIKLRV